MREIKFKVWDPKYKEVFGPFTLEEIALDILTPEWMGTTTYTIKEDLIWLQYTGLKDKNGVEIYEGDVVNCCYGDDDGIVTFNTKSFSGIPGFHVCDKDGTSVEYYYGVVADEEREVVGNIYKNPELLDKF